MTINAGKVTSCPVLMGGHFKSLQLPKGSLKFRNSGAGKVIILGHM